MFFYIRFALPLPTTTVPASTYLPINKQLLVHQLRVYYVRVCIFVRKKKAIY